MHAADIFVIALAYAVLGNAIVLVALLRLNAPVRLWKAGVPLYLYGVCSSLPRRSILTAFALSANVALLIAVSALIWSQTTQP